MKKLKHWAGRIYLIYASLLFLGGFLVLYPFFLLCIHVPGMARFSVFFNKIWCIIFFPFSGQFIEVQGRQHLNLKGPVVFVSNHGSYLDIPVLTWVLPGFICFLGKASLGKVPLFGHYFKRLHLALNRRSPEDRARSITLSVEKIKEGRHMVIFPEGTVHRQQPLVHNFRDGAFRIAIMAGVPVVPVTIAYNWLILPDNNKFSARWHRNVVIINEPVPTTGMTEDDAPALREKVRQQISAQLLALNHRYVSRHVATTASHEPQP